VFVGKLQLLAFLTFSTHDATGLILTSPHHQNMGK